MRKTLVRILIWTQLSTFFFFQENNYTDLDYEYSGSGDYIYFDHGVLPGNTFIHYLTIILFPYLLTIGTIGNIITVILLRRYSFDVWSTCLYVTVLLPMDLIKLYVECGNLWLMHVHSDGLNLSANILLLSNAVCKVYSFTYSLLIHEYEWITVAVAIEIAIATKNPSLIYKMCTRDRATAIILFISVLLISLNLHYFWTSGLVRPEDDPNIHAYACSYINELSNQFRDYIWPNIDFLIGQVIPFMILASIVFTSCYQLVKQRNIDKEQNKRLEKYFLDLKTLMELRIASVYFCFVAVLALLCSITERGLMYFSNKELIEMPPEKKILTFSVIRAFMFIFMSHKFWIFYALCSRFRSDTKSLLSVMCRPLLCKYRKKAKAKRCTLLNQEPDCRRRSLQAGRFTMSEEVENI